MDIREIIKISINLVVIYAIGGILLAGIYAVTSPIIFQKNKEEKEQALSRMLAVHLKMTTSDVAALKESLPEGAIVHSEAEGVLDIIVDGSLINRKMLKRLKKAGATEIEEYSDNMPAKIGDWEPAHKHAEFYAVGDLDNPDSYILETFGKGYSSYINLLVSVGRDHVVKKIKILHHGETPGLGDEILVDSYLKQYEDKTLDNLEVIKGETTEKIQAITGATISTRAVTKGVRDAVEFIQKYEAGEIPAHNEEAEGGSH